MTKEKIKNLLTELVDMIDNGSQRDLDRADEISKSILDVIEQQSCENAISREVVLRLINDITPSGFKKYEYYEYLFDQVDSMPSVQPTRQKGKWTPGDSICPCCGEDKFKDLDADIWSDWRPKYCPNCGAKMESEE